MTLRTSFFNKGIYKSTVKRFSWGAFLYFVILFISTGLSFFLSYENELSYRELEYFKEHPIILYDSYITAPIILSIIVPTIVSLLTFRYIHSKKQSIFIHSIPVTRKANYVSQVLASLTLMLVPVILNTAILVGISICGYGEFFSVADCITWMWFNVLGIVMMYSCATFCANLTGNSFALVCIIVLLHSFLFIAAATLGVMGSVFIYGYDDINPVIDVIAKNNFAVIVFNFMNYSSRNSITLSNVIYYIAVSLTLYVVSYFLYKKRKLETSGDVSSFKCLNHIFKYLVCFVCTMVAFSVFSSYISNEIIVFASVVFIVSVISYFGVEMLLKKTVNVLYAWKGYIGFSVCFIALTLVFSSTSFFGYETKVPEMSDVKEATVYNYYYGETEPFTDNGEIVQQIINIHRDFTDKEIPVFNQKSRYYTADDTRLHIRYKLKEGRTMDRVYDVSAQECNSIMDKLYEYDEYKKKCENIFVKERDVSRIYINHDEEVLEYKELLKLLQKDVLSLSYSELHYGTKTDSESYGVRVEYISHIKNGDEETDIVNSYYIDVTEAYKNSFKWLEEKGYDKIKKYYK